MPAIGLSRTISRQMQEMGRIWDPDGVPLNRLLRQTDIALRPAVQKLF